VPERVRPPSPPHAQPARQDPLAGHQSAAPARTVSAAPAVSTVADERAPVPAARTPAAVPAAEEYVRTLAELPDAIRREVPKVAFGGYMYSPDPADRLVLVDKTLRHEGEEVAPGLLLEKLLPKTAVLNYKGYRFRVGL
jgi:general secretion pathway protein B